MKKLLLVAAMILLAPACQRGQTPTVTEPTTNKTPSTCIESTGEVIKLELTEYQFTPECAVGTSNMGFSIKNNGSEIHNFSIEGTTLADIDIDARAETNTESTGLAAGKYVVFCKYHRESNNMQGELQIK